LFGVGHAQFANGSVLEAELCGAWDGLCCLYKYFFLIRSVHIEGDSLQVTKALQFIAGDQGTSIWFG